MSNVQEPISLQTHNMVSNEQNDNNVPDKTEMMGDDSHLVEEILNELNDNDTSPKQTDIRDVPDTNSQIQYSPPLDNSANNMNPEQLPPTIDVEYDSNDNKMNSLIGKIKKPIIVLCISFIIFNPIVLSSLQNYLPRLFRESGSFVQVQGQTLILSTLVALLFLGTNLLIK